MQLRLASLFAILVLGGSAFGIPVLSIDDPSLQGTTIASDAFTIDTQEPVGPRVPVYSVNEEIVQNSGGTLDFYFKLHNVSDPQPLRSFFISVPNSVQASGFYIDEGNLAPSGAGVGGFSFGGTFDIVGPAIGSGGTDTLIIRTSATAYTSGTVSAFRLSFDDFAIQPATGLVPDTSSVPEPNALVLVAVGVLGLAVKFRRQ